MLGFCQSTGPPPLPLPISHEPATTNQLFKGLGMIRNGFQAKVCLGKTLESHQAVGQGHAQVNAGFMLRDALLQDGHRLVQAA